MAVSVAALWLCPTAHAGTYIWQTTNTSGTVTARSPVISGGSWYTYNDSPKPYSIGYSGSGGSAETGGYAGQISSTGTIRTVYTWQPSYAGEPAPPVVIEQTCEANYLCQTASAPADPCSNGLGDPLVDLTRGDTYQGRSSGTHYRVVSPDAAGTVTVDLVGAQAHAPASSFTDCSVWYTINAYPITVNLTGTTPDSGGGENILVGQRCSASLVCNAPGVTFSNYQWSVPGQVFGTFQVASDQSWSHASNLFTDPDWIRANPQWCWSKDETVTVSCTAQASINGTSIGTVTGQKQVKVWAPDYLFKPSSGPVSVGNIGNPLTLTLYAGGTATGLGGWDPPGAHNGGRVSTPNLFRPAGDGIWQFVQIIYPGRWEDWYDSLGFSHEASLNYDGQKLLDNAWPYPYGSPGLPWPANSVEGSDTSPTYWMEDSPSNPLDNSFYRYHIDESFDDFMMYQPPNSGNGSEWVPLHLYSWKWQADISQTGATWAGGWAPAPPGYVSNVSSARWTTHPEWQHILLNSGMHY